MDIDTRRRRVEQLSPIESKNGGQKLTIADGWKTYGPVSERLLEVEVERLYGLLESIRRRGYRRHDGRIGDINATVLWRSTDDWKWRITGGDHRAAVLRALDYRHIPVRVVGLVRPEEVSIWPNVDAGLYPPAQALDLFDRLVDGEMASVTDNRRRCGGAPGNAENAGFGG